MRDALSSAVFIDRDGTVMEDTDYCSNPKDVRIFPGVIEAMRRLKSRGFKLIIITNQSGIGRGLFTLDQYRAVESEVLRQLGDGLVDATYYCPDAPGQHSKCRKPAPGMVTEAAARRGLRPEHVVVVGDIGADIQAATAAGARGVLVPTHVTRRTEVQEAPLVASDLAGAVRLGLGIPA